MSPESEGAGFPFSGVVGQEEAKLALLLCAVDRRIGGVLLRGDKGSAKTTLARGLAALLPRPAPFVELPVGASEDRVAGTLDIAAALTGGEVRFSPGLLAAADSGVLYVDEVNLLPDHLVDLVLDAAATGVNRVEREGISHAHPSRFVLIGSMNPEEGDLRPQLLDRFGLSVEVSSLSQPDERTDAVRRRLEFDTDPARFWASFAPKQQALAERLAGTHPAVVPDQLVAEVASLCAALGAEGLRADLTICRAAGALAGLEGRPVACSEDVRRVAAMALAHRARRSPFDAAGVDADELSRALDQHLGGAERESAPARGESAPAEGESAPAQGGTAPARGESAPAEGESAPVRRECPPTAEMTPPAVVPLTRGRSASGRGAPGAGRTGRLIRDRPPDGAIGALAVGATVRQVAAHGGAPAAAADLREAVREHKSASLVVFAVDTSGSMGAERRIEAAKAAVLGLLSEAYVRRDLVALIAFGGEQAQVVLRPTSSVEVARARLAEVSIGGRTPLGAGIRAALEVATSPARAATHRPLLVLITDGRATWCSNGTGDPLEEAGLAAEEVRRAGVEAVVVDAETAGGGARLGLAADLARRMDARLLRLDELA